MSTFNEANTVQAMLFDAAGKIGWKTMEAGALPKEGNLGLPLVAEWLKEALLKLNKAKGLTEEGAD